MDLDPEAFLHIGRDQAQVLPEPVHLLNIHGQWDHDLRANVQALFHQQGAGGDYRFHLHAVNGGETQAQTAAAVPQHGI